MIKLQDAELADVLPPYIKSDVDIQAISYAYKMAMRKLLEFARMSGLHANIDKLPSEIIDLMALELRAMYYDETADIRIRRNIVRNAMSWRMKQGTGAAVRSLLETVFKAGEVTEWYQSGGMPGTFGINTGEELGQESVQQFSKILEEIKPLRAHLTGVNVSRYMEQPFYIAVRIIRAPRLVIRDKGLTSIYHVAYKAIHIRTQKYVIVKQQEG